MSILRKIISLPLFFSLFCSLGTFPGLCDTWKVQDLLIDHAYAFANVSGKNGAAYFHITNRGNSADDLIGVESLISEKTSLHQYIHENGVVKMRPVGSIPIPGNSKVILKPGGYHVMLFGLKELLRAGEQFPVKAIFRKSGNVAILVRVVKMRKGDYE